MAVTVTHTKVCNIPDNQTNLARGEVCPSHWNEEHSIVGIDIIEANIRGHKLVDMSNDNYTLTDDEANSAVLLVYNTGDGTKTLTSPTSADDTRGKAQIILTTFAAAKFTLACETGGSTCDLYAGTVYIVSLLGASGAFDVSSYIKTDGRKFSNGISTMPAGDTALDDTSGGILQYGDDGSAQTLTIAAGNVTPNLIVPVFCYGAGGITIQGAMGVTVIGNTSLSQGDKVTVYRDGVTENYYCV